MLVLKLSFARLLHVEINDDALIKYYMENIYYIEREMDNFHKHGDNPAQGNWLTPTHAKARPVGASQNMEEVPQVIIMK